VVAKNVIKITQIRSSSDITSHKCPLIMLIVGKGNVGLLSKLLSIMRIRLIGIYYACFLNDVLFTRNRRKWYTFISVIIVSSS